MQLIEDDRAQVREEVSRVRVAQQQGELLRRRKQHIGRAHPLALPFADRGVRCSRLDAHRKLHFLDGCQQVARNVDRERLERGNIERVQTGAPPGPFAGDQLDKAREEARKRLARTGRSNEQRRAPCPGLFQHRALMRPDGPPARTKPLLEALREQRFGPYLGCGRVGSPFTGHVAREAPRRG